MNKQVNLPDTVVNSLTQMVNELEALKIKNSLLEETYHQLDTHHVILKEQNNVLIDELCLAKIDMNTALGSKKKFLNIISHELMTPLTAIIGFAELLSYADMPQKQKDQVIYVMDASRQLHNMFTELLTHIQLNSGEMTVENKPFSPLSLLTNVSERIYKNVVAKGLSVSTEVDPVLPLLLGDEPLFKHALDILASNAVKFTHQGSISLAAQLLDKKEDRVHVAFTVKDSGIGIPIERQHELFKAFEPLDASLTRPYSGMGLGLSICAQLVKLLGGELDVESSLHSGSLFRMKVWLTPSYID
jgi:signal transduction histidine kinase